MASHLRLGWLYNALSDSEYLWSSGFRLSCMISRFQRKKFLYGTTRHAAGARESQEVREGFDGWRRPYIRSSLSVVQMDGLDAAPVSTAAVASSRPREHTEGPPRPWCMERTKSRRGAYLKK